MDEEELIKAAMTVLSKRGASKGGKARAKSMTAERRSEIAKKAAKKRWAKKKPAADSSRKGR